MGTVEAIHINTGEEDANGDPMKRLDAIQIVADRGLEGDTKGRAGSRRQVLIVPSELLDEFGLHPGDTRENLTVRGLDVNELPGGTLVRVGEALLESTISCTPCGFIDRIRPGLKEELRGRRGMLFRVLEGGAVHQGDEVRTLEDSER
jgi:MOSC domain-containing protein YiiM